MATRTADRPPSLWRNRDYIVLWSGQSVSRISGIVIPLLVLGISRSAAEAGPAGALSALPYALFGLPAGTLHHEILDGIRWIGQHTLVRFTGLMAAGTGWSAPG